jgi:hypothetical protein
MRRKQRKSTHSRGCDRLLNDHHLNPTLDCVDHPWWPDYVQPGRRLGIGEVPTQPIVSIIGPLDDGLGLNVTMVMRMPTRADTVRGPSTESIAELVGGEGETPARAPVRDLSWCLGAAAAAAAAAAAGKSMASSGRGWCKH